MVSDSEDVGIDLFQEPEGFYEPEKQPTFATHKLLSGKDLSIRLVGHNPLWVRFPSCQ
jgi:nicotinamide N-methyltransferase